MSINIPSVKVSVNAAHFLKERKEKRIRKGKNNNTSRLFGPSVHQHNKASFIPF